MSSRRLPPLGLYGAGLVVVAFVLLPLAFLVLQAVQVAVRRVTPPAAVSAAAAVLVVAAHRPIGTSG